ncbi:MAG TPA: RICIN domain-containing protein, partial [Polyangia bacterium]|nr:RICIN domain-containing protein [Polyangia bacterium]
ATPGSPVATSSVFTMTASGANWVFSPTSNSAMCLDATNGANGTDLVLAACSGAASQAFSISPDSSSGNFIIKASSGRCVQAQGSSGSAGAAVESDDCVSGSAAQLFVIQAVGTTGTGVTSTVSSSGGSTGTGGSTGGSTGTGGTTMTYYRMVTQQNTTQSLEVDSAATGTSVYMWNTLAVDTQAFAMLDAGNGNVKLALKANTAACIGPIGHSTASGTNLEVEACDGSSNQAWTKVQNSGKPGYWFKNVASGLCMDVHGGGVTTGALVQIYTCNTSPSNLNQYFMPTAM